MTSTTAFAHCKRICSLWVPVVCWAGIIFYFSSQPNLKIDPDPLRDLILRKGAHMFFFGTLQLLFMRALGTKNYIFAFIATLIYAITDEFHQGFTVGRQPSAQDVMIDMLGAIVMFILWKSLVPLLNKHKA